MFLRRPIPINLKVGLLVLLSAGVSADFNNGTDFNCTEADYDLYDGRFVTVENCTGNWNETNENGTDCAEMGLGANPCLIEPCGGEDTCVDLTLNGTVCNESLWEQWVEEEFDATDLDLR